MFDGFKVLSLSVSANTLLHHDSLTFPLSVDESTGALLDQPRRATDNGLTFCLMPTRADRNQYRVELSGSLHRYSRNGLHNADDFTILDLLEVLDRLITTYGVNPFSSHLNNVEFGVNLQLPFAVDEVLRALICYKGVPFTLHHENGFNYYQAPLSQYIVKVYDKGTQYRALLPDLHPNVLRFEVKVITMQYLHGRGINLLTLADLMTVDHYPQLGRVLVETFTGILFNEPLLSVDVLSTRQRELLLRGRNPHYWRDQHQNLPPYRINGNKNPVYDAQKKRLQREEERFRTLLHQHRPGNDWQGAMKGLIAETWERLTTVEPDVLQAIEHHRQTWQNSVDAMGKTGIVSRETLRVPDTQKCPVPSKVLEPTQTGKMSSSYPLYVVQELDKHTSTTGVVLSHRGTPQNGVVVCPVTGVKLHQPKPHQRFVSATMLRNDDELMKEVSGLFGQYAKGSKENDFVRAAHGARNKYFNEIHNPPNNLKRSINKPYRYGQQTLPFVEDTLRLTPEQRAALGQ